MPADLKFLDALSESLGVSLAFREDLTCCLSTPEGCEIQIEYAPEQDAIGFTAALGYVPAGDERLLRLLQETDPPHIVIVITIIITVITRNRSSKSN